MAGQRWVSATIEDAPGFNARLDAALRRIQTRTEDNLERMAHAAVTYTKMFCPVDTGNLRSHYTATKHKDELGVYWIIGTNVHYAVYVEFGTRHNQMQPHLRPGVATAVARGLARESGLPAGAGA